MEIAQPLRNQQPLVGLTPHERRAVYSSSGMYSPNLDMRTDADAFELRSDVSVEDACVTALRLLRMAVAQLELLGTSADLAPTYRDVVDGVACLGRMACGTVGIVHAALCDTPFQEKSQSRVER